MAVFSEDGHPVPKLGEIESFGQLFNDIRTHEHLDFATSLETYLRQPS
jgi:hypothetical protein